MMIKVKKISNKIYHEIKFVPIDVAITLAATIDTMNISTLLHVFLVMYSHYNA